MGGGGATNTPPIPSRRQDHALYRRQLVVGRMVRTFPRCSLIGRYVCVASSRIARWGGSPGRRAATPLGFPDETLLHAPQKPNKREGVAAFTDITSQSPVMLVKNAHCNAGNIPDRRLVLFADGFGNPVFVATVLVFPRRGLSVPVTKHMGCAVFTDITYQSALFLLGSVVQKHAPVTLTTAVGCANCHPLPA
jgi:hypothetical protein